MCGFARASVCRHVYVYVYITSATMRALRCWEPACAETAEGLRTARTRAGGWAVRSTDGWGRAYSKAGRSAGRQLGRRTDTWTSQRRQGSNARTTAYHAQSKLTSFAQNAVKIPQLVFHQCNQLFRFKHWFLLVRILFWYAVLQWTALFWPAWCIQRRNHSTKGHEKWAKRDIQGIIRHGNFRSDNSSIRLSTPCYQVHDFKIRNSTEALK